MQSYNYFVTLTSLRYIFVRMKLHSRSATVRNFYSSNVSEKEYGENGRRFSEQIDTGQPVMRLALKLLYIGAGYKGMQYQDSLTNTIEEHLFRALVKMRMIQDRTENAVDQSVTFLQKGPKVGVSPVGFRRVQEQMLESVPSHKQVIAFDVHHQFLEQLRKYAHRTEVENEHQHVDIDVKHFISPIKHLNRMLPVDIKVLAWAKVPVEFNPRRQKQIKTYKYWFRKEGLDLKAMTDACKKFEGTHDFRNLCTLQYKPSFVCHVTSAMINECGNDPKVGVFTVSGDRFLMHQIRYMMGILFLIGQGKEDPAVIDELLDVETNPCKPHYPKAPASPLCLFKTELKDDIKWFHCADIYHKVYELVNQKYTESMLMTTLTKGILDELKNTVMDSEDDSRKLEAIMRKNTKTFKRTEIMSKQKGPTVEKFFAKYESRILRKKILKGEIIETLHDEINRIEHLFLTSEHGHQDVNDDLIESSTTEESDEADIR